MSLTPACSSSTTSLSWTLASSLRFGNGVVIMAHANTKLAKLRRANKLSREQLCALAQGAGHTVSYPALVQYERGERHPKLGLAMWLSRYFELTVEELFNGKGETNGNKKDTRGEDRASCV